MVKPKMRKSGKVALKYFSNAWKYISFPANENIVHPLNLEAHG
jgi:hypothetical protein